MSVTPIATHAAIKSRIASEGKGLKFGRNNEFQAELKKRVDEFFNTTGKPRRDVPAMYLKTAILFTSLIACYIGLVFLISSWWLAIPVSILLGLTIAGIGFNVQHDGGHQAYSKHAWINKTMALSLDLIGGSSYVWHYKHGVYHHTYVNITHEDTDIDMGALARVTPHQKRYWFHRFQHLYIWPLYGLFVIKWHLVDDFKDVLKGKIGDHKIPRPKGWDLAAFLGGKALFLFLAFALPLLMHHSLGTVALFYLITVATMGCVLSVVFQLAHAVEHAEFPMPNEGGSMENSWAIHQVQTTVDFARRSRMAAWLLGGLNFQIEHHLLPRICHINFPALSKIVQQTCDDFGIIYAEHRTFLAGVASHYRWLRQMGQPA